ncbi:MAG: GGDEF domain-containing protein, partial [Synergistaceae bacterium]|nr:GGDEF domain-containing protein [Synergistaceae bacterium]
ILDFFFTFLFLFFRWRMETLSLSAIRGFLPPLLLFLNLLPLGASYLEVNLEILLLRHIVTLLGSGIYMEFRPRDVFFTYMGINAFAFGGAFFLAGDLQGEMINLAICYFFILSSMLFFSLLQREKTLKIASLSHSQKEAKALAFKDPLTGRFNRRFFDKSLSRLLKRGTDLALFLLDMDDFKSINDTRGHPEGDQALKNMASAIEQVIRKGDIAARIGGDEFAIILPECPEKNGRIIAENLCRKAGLFTPPLSVSIGMVHVAGGINSAEAFARADQALYAAKATGKGRVMASPAMTATTAV